VLDSVNCMYGRTTRSFRDPDDSSVHPHWMDSSKLALNRLFRDFKHPGLSFGTVVCATSVTKPKTLQQFLSEVGTVTNRIAVPHYSMQEFYSTMQYYRQQLLFAPITRGTKKYIYYLCSGRGAEIYKYCLML